MLKARILGLAQPRKCLLPTSHLCPCHARTHTDILLVTPAVEIARLFPTTRQHTALLPQTTATRE